MDSELGIGVIAQQETFPEEFPAQELVLEPTPLRDGDTAYWHLNGFIRSAVEALGAASGAADADFTDRLDPEYGFQAYYLDLQIVEDVLYWDNYAPAACVERW